MASNPDLKRAQEIEASVREQFSDPQANHSEERVDAAIKRALQAEGLYDTWKEARG